ncbi:MAG TPA: DUF4349 domain-containing protein [Chloroflexota bacterium]|nr:DUF4349 domain-containing protein [Chloroflexota bacterium]
MRVRRIVAAVLTVGALTACGQAAVPTSAPADRAAQASYGAAPAAGAAAAAKPAEAPKPAEPPKPAAAPTQAPAAAAPAAPARLAAAPAEKPAAGEQRASELAQTTIPTDKPWDRMIIRNGTLSLWVENVERAVEQARQVAGKYDGFVSGSNTRIEKVKVGEKEEERQFATLTLQVPSRTFDPAVQELRRLGLKVESEVATSQDVTEEYVDLDSNLRNLRRTEDAVAAMLAKAQKLEEVMMLTRELTQIRGQIERLEGRKRFLERRSDFSSVTLNLQLPPPAAATPTPVPTPVGWNPSATAERGWNASLRVLRAVADVVILAVAFGWWLVPFGAVAAYAALRVRARPPERADG